MLMLRVDCVFWGDDIEIEGARMDWLEPGILPASCKVAVTWRSSSML